MALPVSSVILLVFSLEQFLVVNKYRGLFCGTSYFTFFPICSPPLIPFALQDFPLVALSQARLGWSADAIVDMLLMPVIKNKWFDNGMVFQRDSLPAYLPANGGLLLAIAALAGGTPTSPALNFPATWGAQAEGFVMPYP